MLARLFGYSVAQPLPFYMKLSKRFPGHTEQTFQLSPDYMFHARWYSWHKHRGVDAGPRVEYFFGYDQAKAKEAFHQVMGKLNTRGLVVKIYQAEGLRNPDPIHGFHFTLTSDQHKLLSQFTPSVKIFSGSSFRLGR